MPHFVVKNGRHRFNRPLYAGNTGFHTEAGDKPEFALFLPCRGGNLRLGLVPAHSAKPPLWLHSARSFTARYRCVDFAAIDVKTSFFNESQRMLLAVCRPLS